MLHRTSQTILQKLFLQLPHEHVLLQEFLPGHSVFSPSFYHLPSDATKIYYNSHWPYIGRACIFHSHQPLSCKANGQVLISTVDSPHYNGAFQFDDAAKIAGFMPPEVYPFDPASFIAGNMPFPTVKPTTVMGKYSNVTEGYQVNLAIGMVFLTQILRISL